MDVGQAETRQTGDLGAIQISAKAQRDQLPLALPEFCQRSLELGIDPQPLHRRRLGGHPGQLITFFE